MAEPRSAEDVLRGALLGYEQAEALLDEPREAVEQFEPLDSPDERPAQARRGSCDRPSPRTSCSPGHWLLFTGAAGAQTATIDALRFECRRAEYLTLVATAVFLLFAKRLFGIRRGGGRRSTACCDDRPSTTPVTAPASFMLGHVAGKSIYGVALALAAAALFAGCGGGKKAAPAGSAPSESRAAIKENWETFFDGSTPAAHRLSLLENGPDFASLLKAVNSSPLAKQVKATVSGVKIDSPSSATVTYTVLLGKQPVLADATGEAVLVDGTWKVGVASFCKLLALEGVVPAACSSAGK
jgi:hypothetical protein